MADCSSVVDPSCITSLPGSIAGGAADAGVSGLAKAMQKGAQWVMDNTMGWWVNVPSIDLAASPVQHIQSQVRWIAVAVAIAGVTWQGIRMTVSRKPGPIVDVGRGLITVALWSAIGVVAVQLALNAADSYSTWVLDAAAQGQAQEKLSGLAQMAQIEAPGAVIVLSLLMIIAGILQAVLMFFREGAIIVLTGLVVVAAAGAFTGSTRPWIHKWLSWMLALVIYKPVAATIYAVAIQVVGDGRDTRTIFIGLTMIVMSLIALPTLMKLFSFAMPALGGASGMAAVSGGAIMGYTFLAPHRAGVTGSVEQARMLSQDMPRGGGGGGASGAGGGTTLMPAGGRGGGGMGAAPASALSSAGGGAAPASARGAAAATAGPMAAPAPAAAGGASAAGGRAAAGAGPAGIALAAAQAGHQVAEGALNKAGGAMGGEPA